MKFNLVCTGEGFVPCTDEDYEKKKTLKRGAVYEVTVKEFRNYQFHKKYFSLINLSWEYLSEEQRNFFHDNTDAFRKCVEVAAGNYEPVYNVKKREWTEVPKSIAFDKMSESDFSNLYERVKDVLFEMFLGSVNQEAFEQELKWF